MSEAFRADLVRPLHELLVGHAAHRPAQTAFSDGRRSVTYAQLDRRTARVAGHLADLGLERGASAVIYLPNRVETVESYLAVTRASAVGVPLNPRSTDAELAYLLDDCAARMVIAGAAELPQVLRVVAERPGVAVVAVAGPDETPDPGLPLYETLATTWSLRCPPRDDLGLDEPAWLLYTSGTTGEPKGVVSTQRTSLWATASCSAPVLGLSAEDRVLWPMPLFHCVAHNLCVLGVLAVGATARITDGLAADEILRTAREERSTFLVGGPTMYHHMVEQARTCEVDTPRLRVCMVAGSPCPASLHTAFRDAFGVALLDSYGSTETGGAITTNLPGGPYVPGSCGLPLPGLTLRLTDPRTGAEVPEGGEGEVWVSSPALMLGYHGRPEDTGAVLSDGWYRTGDLARRDQAGYVTITGRLKELIIRGGENIHPVEVEKVLTRVPGVIDAAVGGAPHEALGEVPVAYLVTGPDGVDPEAVLAACRARLSYFKLPEEIHEVEEIPRNPAGEIARKRLARLDGRLLWRKARPAARAARSHESAGALGLLGTGHPLLEAAVELPDTDGVLFSGLLPAHGRDPLLSRTLAGTAVVPAAVLVELALHAGHHVGCGRLLALDTEDPLVLPERGGTQLRVTVGPADGAGARPVAVHTRRDDGGAAGRPWTRHASGTLAPGTGPAPGWDLAAWPPADALKIAPAPGHDGPDRHGTGHAGTDHADTDHGGAPRPGGAPGLVRAVWQRDGDLFAEVALPEGAAEQGAAYGLHPALLDAVLQAVPPGAPDTGEPRAGGQGADPSYGWRDVTGEPDGWRGVTLHATGPAVLRVRLCPGAAGTWRVEAADGAGDPVATVESVALRRLSPRALRTASAAQQDGLFTQVWVGARLPPAPGGGRWAVVGGDPLGARAGLMAAGRYVGTHADLRALARGVAAGSAAPDVVVVSWAPAARSEADDTAGTVGAAVRQGLDWARRWADPLFADARLVVLTRDAVPSDGEPARCLSGAALWGLAGAAQDRAPGRFVLVDTDASEGAWRALPGAVASGEPRLALRGGSVLTPRTERVAVRREVAPPAPAEPGTVLVVDCADGTDNAAARHLVAADGVREVLVAGPSASGDTAAPGAPGRSVPVAEWDAWDPVASARLALKSAPGTVLLTASVAAAVAASGPGEEGDGEVDAALRPVVDTAFAFGTALAGTDVAAFVLSSPGPGGGLVGDAVGAFLDAWAGRLRAQGVPAVSVRGPEPRSGAARALFDAARSLGPAAVLAQRPALSGPLAPGPLTGTGALRRALVRGGVRRAARDTATDPSGLRHRLAALSGEEQEEAVLGLVREHIATVLGLRGAAQVPPEGETRDLGFDSLTALTARDALRAATGLALPAAVVFDFATPAALAGHLRKELLAR